jgi:hypothetical protein
MAIAVPEILRNERLASRYVRNGTRYRAHPTTRQSSIPCHYFWSGPVAMADWNGSGNINVVLAGGAGAGDDAIPVVPDSVVIAAHVASAWCQFVKSRLDAIRRNPPAAPAAAAVGVVAPAAPLAVIAWGQGIWAAGNPALAAAIAVEVADTSTRIIAVGLGAARAAVASTHGITAAELKPVESRAAWFVITPPAATHNAAVLQNTYRHPTHGWTYQVTAGLPAWDNEIALSAPALTDIECRVTPLCFMIGMAAPTRGGEMLIKADHHYLSDADSRKRHLAIEKEVLAKFSQAVKAYWRTNKTVLQDAIWHKSIHAAKEIWLTEMAMDTTVIENLGEDFGTMAVGLPAREDVLRKAGSYTQVAGQVTSLMASHGTVVDTRAFDNAVAWMSATPTTGNIPDDARNFEGAGNLLALPLVAVAGDRKALLKQWFSKVLEAAASDVAFCFGYYKQLAMDTGIRINSEEGSLLRSYSLKKLYTSHLPSISSGTELCRLVRRRKKDQLEDGRLPVYEMAFGSVARE